MKTVADIIAESPARWGVAARNLDDGRALFHSAGESFETASVIKLSILVTLLKAVESGKLSLWQAVKVEARHVGRNGSGQLANLHLRLPFELYNLAMLMMTISDNVATNVILELLGGPTVVNQCMAELGYSSIRLHIGKLDFPTTYRTDRDRLSSGTAGEYLSLLEKLYSGTILNESHTKLSLKMLSRVNTSHFTRQIPYGHLKAFGSKTGWIAMHLGQPVAMSEVGYLKTRRGQTILFAVMKVGPLDRRLRYSLDAKYRQEMAKLGAALVRELG